MKYIGAAAALLGLTGIVLFSNTYATARDAGESLRNALGFIPDCDQLTLRSGTPAFLNIEEQPHPPLSLPSVSRSELYRFGAAKHINEKKGFITDLGVVVRLSDDELKDVLLGTDAKAGFGVIRYDVINLRGTYRHPEYFKDDYNEFYLESHVMGFPLASIMGMESPFTVAYRSRNQILSIMLQPRHARTLLLTQDTGGSNMLVLRRKWSDKVFEKTANLVPFALQIPEDLSAITEITVVAKSTLYRIPDKTPDGKKTVLSEITIDLKPGAEGWCLNRMETRSFVLLRFGPGKFPAAPEYMTYGLDNAEAYDENGTRHIKGSFPAFITGWLPNDGFSVR